MKTKQDNSKTYRRQNTTLPSADFYCLYEKKSSDECEPATLRGIIASVKRYLKNVRYISATASLVQRSTVELFERHLFKRISRFRDETLDQSVCTLRQRAASCDFAKFEDDHIRVNR